MRLMKHIVVAGWFGWRGQVMLMNGLRQRESVGVDLETPVTVQFCQSIDQARSSYKVVDMHTRLESLANLKVSFSCPRVDMHGGQRGCEPALYRQASMTQGP
jgi:hypothetical protein